jgi:indolepyruvate ferredoxin oxidoreductase
LAFAAHIEGKGCSVLDMSGLAQKGGPVMSHVRLCDHADEIFSTRISTGAADLVIGCDAIVAASRDALTRMGEGRTHAAVNSAASPTAAFIKNPDWQFPEASAEADIHAACGNEGADFIDAGRLAVALMGDDIATNMFMLGYAWQKGWVPLSEAAILAAIEQNGVSGPFTKQAFAWGRLAAHDMVAVRRAAGVAEPGSQVIQFKRSLPLNEVIKRRMAFLEDYQDEDYADQYGVFVAEVSAIESALPEVMHSSRLAEAVARNLFKLMAYKDEYEVARLYSSGEFKEKIAQTFEGKTRLKFHLAPPVMARFDAQGRPLKRTYGTWMMGAFHILAKMKFLRGTAFDPFGRSEERKMERALIVEYQNLILGLLPHLSAKTLPLAVAIASVPEQIRGFGHVKERNVREARKKWKELSKEFEAAAKDSRCA